MELFANFLANIPLVTSTDLGKHICHGFISPATILSEFETHEFGEDFCCDCDDEDCEMTGWSNWESTMESQWEDCNYEFDSLLAAIETEGFGTPVLLNTESKTYWNGHHRLFVARELDLPFIPFISGEHYFRVTCDHFYNVHQSTSYHKLNA